MKNLFDREQAAELTERIERLRPDSPRQWGKMTPAQAMAHCAAAMEWAVGDHNPGRSFLAGSWRRSSNAASWAPKT